LEASNSVIYAENSPLIYVDGTKNKIKFAFSYKNFSSLNVLRLPNRVLNIEITSSAIQYMIVSSFNSYGYILGKNKVLYKDVLESFKEVYDTYVFFDSNITPTEESTGITAAGIVFIILGAIVLIICIIGMSICPGECGACIAGCCIGLSYINC